MVGGAGEYYRGLVDASKGQIIPFVGQERLYCLPAGKAGKFFPRWLPMLWRIPKEMKKVTADVVFAGEVLPVGTALWVFHWYRRILHLFISSSLHLQYGVFLHGLDLALTGRKRWIARQVLKNATWVIANSENTKKIALGYGIDPEKITVLTPCPAVEVSRHAELVSASQRSRNKFGMTDADGFRLLTIARFVQRKGYDTAVAGAEELKKKRHAFVWTFMGDGPDRSRIEALATQLDVTDCIRFEHSATGQQLSNFYRTADCFVFLPRELPGGDVEGFGMVCLEAALYGLPIVASKSGGVPEAVVDGVTGVLTSATDTKKIAQDIIDVMSDSSTMQKMGIAGRGRVLKEFQWRDRVERLLGLLKSTL